MNIKSTNLLFFIGLIGFFIIGSSFLVDIYGAFYGNRDIYWTHQSMKLPLEETNNDVQVYISGKLLQKHLTENALFVRDNNGMQNPILPKDVFVRLNNWNKVKSRILTKATFTGIAFGIILTLLITGVIQIFVQKKKC